MRLAVVGLVAVAVAAVSAASGGASAGTEPVAHTVRSIATVGPLFIGGPAGPELGLPHYCTASVVHSPGHDLIVTAAHCIAGNGTGIVFAPGYHDGISPHGVWRVRRVYLLPLWRSDQNPRRDFALLEVAARNGRNVEDVTGSAPRLGTTPDSGAEVTVDAYNAGARDRPITCRVPIYYTGLFPSFDCNGYQNGASGGPWLFHQHVVGVIGGLHAGGCTARTSYSAFFGAAIARLYARAVAGGAGDVAPLSGGAGC